MYHPLELHITSETGSPVVRFTIAGVSSALGVTDIEAMIAQLVNVRAAIQPGRPLDPPPDGYAMEVDPCWRVDVAPQFNGAVLSLRHAGVGWTAFALPSTNLSKLVEVLSTLKAGESSTAQTMLN